MSVCYIHSELMYPHHIVLFTGFFLLTYDVHNHNFKDYTCKKVSPLSWSTNMHYINRIECWIMGTLFPLSNFQEEFKFEIYMLSICARLNDDYLQGADLAEASVHEVTAPESTESTITRFVTATKYFFASMCSQWSFSTQLVSKLVKCLQTVQNVSFSSSKR